MSDWVWHCCRCPRFQCSTSTLCMSGPLRRLVFVLAWSPSMWLQPEGPSFNVTGNHVSWQKWDFRVSFNYREGLVLHNLKCGSPTYSYQIRLLSLHSVALNPESLEGFLSLCQSSLILAALVLRHKRSCITCSWGQDNLFMNLLYCI